MFRYFLAMVLALAAVAAHAKGGPDARIEASMLVTGHVDIETDGSVSSLSIHREEEVPGYVADLVKRASPGWRFKPVLVDGKAVPARARMTLRMRATPLDDGDMAVSIASAWFGDRYPEGSDYVSRVRMRPPTYPLYALDRNAEGTVYLILRIGRDGKVADAFAEQINLRGIGPDSVMDTLRKEFSRAALVAARRWQFAPPTTGKQADDPDWSVRVPVVFMMGDNANPEEAYGKWMAYVPGPRRPAPWASPDWDDGNDALADGSLRQAGTGFRLLTPLQN